MCTQTRIFARIGFFCSLVPLVEERMRRMRERDIERKLVVEIKKLKGLCEKWTAGSSGWPDRIVMLPGRSIAFVEVKAPGKKPRPLQLKRHEKLRQLGYQVFVLDDPDKIAGIIDEIQSGGDA